MEIETSNEIERERNKISQGGKSMAERDTSQGTARIKIK
jgi:hypothetical protein